MRGISNFLFRHELGGRSYSSVIRQHTPLWGMFFHDGTLLWHYCEIICLKNWYLQAANKVSSTRSTNHLRIILPYRVGLLTARSSYQFSIFSSLKTTEFIPSIRKVPICSHPFAVFRPAAHYNLVLLYTFLNGLIENSPLCAELKFGRHACTNKFLRMPMQKLPDVFWFLCDLTLNSLTCCHLFVDVLRIASLLLRGCYNSAYCASVNELKCVILWRLCLCLLSSCYSHFSDHWINIWHLR